MTLQKKISIVIPSFNEEGNIKIIVNALNEVLQKINYSYELIFVDDGSSDKTLRILQEISTSDANVFYIELSRNFGHQNALKAGLDLATGDCIITMDGDMQHPPEMIPQLIEKWEKVVGVTCNDWGVKQMKTKWGACNTTDKRIWLNLELAKKPTICLEYILVHELVHLHERNHNDRFIALMDKFMPKWRLHRDELNSLPIVHNDWGY